MIKYRSDSKFCLALGLLRSHQKHNIEYARNRKKTKNAMLLSIYSLKILFHLRFTGVNL